jgi:SNF2 family DNA or RNA helicase
MTINIEVNFIYIQCNEQQAKKLDAVWVKSRNAWRLPNTLGALRELHRLGFDVAEYGKQKAKERERLLSVKNSKPTAYQDKRLRPYQQTDIDFLQHIPNAGVFNEPRTGKSITTLKLCETEKRKKNLIVCPASLVINWANEIKKFTIYTPFPVSGTKTKRIKTYEAFKNASEGYLIISKETLRQDVNIIESM